MNSTIIVMATPPPEAGPVGLHLASSVNRPIPQYPASEWESKKPLIKCLYIDQRKPLKDVRSIMSSEHNFHPSLRMYKWRLDKWGFDKNLTEGRVRSLTRQRTISGGVEATSKVFWGGRRMPDQRIEKYLKRKKMSLYDFTTGEESSNGCHTVSQPTAGFYEENCPYRPWPKKFRLIETFPNGAKYCGDSFGNHWYIDIHEDRPCTTRCLCRMHEPSEDFTFLAYKTLDGMDITIFSADLLSELLSLIESEDLRLRDQHERKTIDGLMLLKHYRVLHDRLEGLRFALPLIPGNSSLTSEMGLLVHGLLGDGDVFKSFGFENLHESGLLDYELWKTFQQQKLQKDIDALDDAFNQNDDIEESEMSSLRPDSLGLESTTAPSVVDLEEPAAVAYDPLLSLPEPSVCAPLGNSHDTEITSTMTKFNDHEGTEVTGIAMEPILPRRLYNSPLHVNANTTLVEAAKAGHAEVVRHLLAGGADANISSRFGYGTEPTPLFEAAKAGHAEVVRHLLAGGSDVNSRIKMQDGTESTPLFEAAKAGHAEVVRHLLASGIDINAITSSGTALSAAASASRGSVIRLLLQQGADIQVAAVFLQNSNGKRGLRTLLRTSSCIPSSAYPDVTGRTHSQNASSIRYLRVRFIYQYEGMKEAAQSSSTKFQDATERFPNHRTAWEAGITTMRRLSRGQPPSDICDTISFLCLAKAIVEALRDCDDIDYVQEFLRDLSRWQILFPSSADLAAYQDAMQLMWGVELDSCDEWDERALERFRELASTLVSRANGSFGISLFNNGNGYLESSQQRWLERTSQISSDHDHVHDALNLGLSGGHMLQQPEIIHPRPPDPPVSSNKGSLREKIAADGHALAPVVALLMAGAIFAIILIFFQVWRKLSATSIRHSMKVNRVGVGSLSERCLVLTRYMELKSPIWIQTL